jgi:SH3-like domain-containing protein
MLSRIPVALSRASFSCAKGLGVLAAVALAFSVQAAEYRSVASATVLYDAPSAKSRRLYVAPAGMPVELISTVGAWAKARDESGDFFWLEQRLLSTRRMVVATVNTVVRTQAQEGASAAFGVERGVLLEINPAETTSPEGWLPVRHRDGPSGWVKSSDVWGAVP